MRARRGFKLMRAHQAVDEADSQRLSRPRTGLPVSISSMAGRTPRRRTAAHRAAEIPDGCRAAPPEARARGSHRSRRRDSGRRARAPGRRPAQSHGSRQRSGRAVLPAGRGRPCPARMSAKASSGPLKAVNSRMSAPAMKPLGLPSARSARAAGWRPVLREARRARSGPRSRARSPRCRACPERARRCRRHRGRSSSSAGGSSWRRTST